MLGRRGLHRGAAQGPCGRVVQPAALLLREQLGGAIVTAFFCVSGVVVAWAGRIADSFTLPAALGMFFVKAVVLFGLLGALPEDGWLDRLTLAWTVVVGALLWSGIQLRWVWTRQIYYVPPPPPPTTQD